jgi:hypothetical protein
LECGVYPAFSGRAKAMQIVRYPDRSDVFGIAGEIAGH